MTQSISISSSVSTSASLLIRTLVAIVLLTVLFFIIRRAIGLFTGVKSLQLGRKRYWLVSINLLAILILFLIRSPVEATLQAVGKSLEAVVPILEPGYPEAVLAGLSDCAATGVLHVKAKHSKPNPMGRAGQTDPKGRGEK